MCNNNEDKDFSLFWTIAIAIVVCLALWIGGMFLTQWYASKHFMVESTDGNIYALFGDSFGAVNALISAFAFAGVIVAIVIQRNELRLQRKDLKLQQTEMQETRREFLINRTTNLVYIQLDRFERCINELIIIHEGKTYIGNDAISFLDKNEQNVYKPFDKSEEEYNAEMKAAVIKFLKIHSPSKSYIEKFAHNAYNAVEALKRIIYKSNLEINQLNDIKNLFFVNIGSINMGVIEHISEYSTKELEYLSPEEYETNGIEDVGMLIRANIFLKPIVEFYHIRLTEGNFEELKQKWIESRGNEG